MAPSYAYLDLDVDGHREKHARARAFVAATNLRYGFDGDDLDGLGGAQRSRIVELYEADREWGARGAIRIDAPTRERVVFELFDAKSARACENFRALCEGMGTSRATGRRRTYEGSRMHRCVRNFMMQGGDYTHGNGAGGESIWGKKFKDDAGGLKLKHDAMGVLSMSNTGKNSNSSQFFVTLGACKHLDGKHVVFGKCVRGMDVLERINDECAVDAGGASEEPKVPVVVAGCGVLDALD